MEANRREKGVIDAGREGIKERFLRLGRRMIGRDDESDSYMVVQNKAFGEFNEWN